MEGFGARLPVNLRLKLRLELAVYAGDDQRGSLTRSISGAPRGESHRARGSAVLWYAKP